MPHSVKCFPDVQSGYYCCKARLCNEFSVGVSTLKSWSVISTPGRNPV